MDIISDKEISVFDNNVNYDFSGVEKFNKITIFNFEDNKTKDYLENAMKKIKLELLQRVYIRFYQTKI